MKAECLLADRGYDANYIIDYAEELDMSVVITKQSSYKIDKFIARKIVIKHCLIHMTLRAY